MRIRNWMLTVTSSSLSILREQACLLREHVLRNSRLIDTATVALWLRHPPREREFVGSIPGRVIPKTLKLAF